MSGDESVHSSDGTERPEVVCLCGSTRFKDRYRAENRRLTMEGKIVLSVGLFGHADSHEFTEEEKAMLDDLHKQKIDMADRVHIIHEDGYVGNSTVSEIDYAKSQRTEVTWLDEDRYVEPGTDHEISSDGGSSSEDLWTCTGCGRMVNETVNPAKCPRCGDNRGESP